MLLETSKDGHSLEETAHNKVAFKEDKTVKWHSTTNSTRSRSLPDESKSGFPVLREKLRIIFRSKQALLVLDSA